MTLSVTPRRSEPRPRALVTGGAGFIGSHLVDRLVAEGMEVLVVDDLSTGRTANLDARARLEVADVATARLTRLLRGWRPEAVFHLAAQASVPLSLRDPLRDLSVNVVGTHNVASAAREVGAARLVFVSSGGAIYGETARPATERTRPNPTSYYGIHKLAAEGHVGLSGVSHAIARPANVYGPRQAAGLEGAVVASFIEQAQSPSGFLIHGDGRQTRDFVHVNDVVGALWALGFETRSCGIWNIATGQDVSVLELASLVERSIRHEVARSFGPRRPGDITRSAVSARRLRRLGWEPMVDLAAGIAGLVETLDSTGYGEASPR